ERCDDEDVPRRSAAREQDEDDGEPDDGTRGHGRALPGEDAPTNRNPRGRVPRSRPQGRRLPQGMSSTSSTLDGLDSSPPPPAAAVTACSTKDTASMPGGSRPPGSVTSKVS